jgi:hypothetical protein
MLVAIGVIFLALGVVAVVIVVVRPQLREPESAVKYWTFDLQADDVNPLLDFDVIDQSPGDAAVAIGPEGLTHDAAVTGDSAWYMQKQLPGPVERIGVTATFPPAAAGTTGGAVGLLVLSHALPSDPQSSNSDTPDVGIHFVFDARTWTMGVWGSQGVRQVLGGGTFEPLLSGARSLEIVRQSGQVTIYLPDGLSRTFRDPNIARWSGNWAACELYEEAGATPAVIHRLWVGWSA